MKNKIDAVFKSQGWDWSAKRLAEDVLRLSDFYIQNPKAQTPWQHAWAQRALLVYYWPLNSIRLQRVIDDLKSVDFFSGIDSFLDFGAGPGTASWLLKDLAPIKAIETSQTPQNWFPELDWVSSPQIQDKTCVVFSYSLTELSQIPEALQKASSFIILEPSTQEDGRLLLQLRQQLIDTGYYVWAPCPHQQSCPLFTKSKTDWCHDRVHFEAPAWFMEIEKYLPMKNKTLTLSYLALKKQAPAKADWARLTGDQLNEKGKTRQLICRGPDREFLAWMHRDGTPPEFFRGEKVQLESFEIKSNELRIKSLKRFP